MPDYRPWGLLDWVLPRCAGVAPWALLGCLSTGERSLAAWHVLREQGALRSVRLLQIANRPSRHDAEIQRRERERINEFAAAGGSTRDIEAHQLLEEPAKIVDVIDRWLAVGDRNAILDVSTLPKRFFFPMLKRLLKSTIPNLIVTYTSPKGYTPEKLAENPDQWDHLPLFSGSYENAKAEMMVINVGFEGLGLQDQVDHGDSGLPIKLLVPFPAAPQAFRRSWELVRRLQKHRADDTFRVYLADAKDLSDAFDRLVSLTNRGKSKALLAPFGPKPISVAMCIYATLTESQVYYSQPSVYHPNYSYGVAQVGTSRAVWAYCVRLNGRSYYDLM